MNASARARPTPPRRGLPLPIQILALLAVCAFVYFFRLGEGGLFGTEAHRAVPAYELLDAVRDHADEPGDWFVPRMFEQPYLRKPPGMPWAIAGLSAALGETVFAARAVSALSCTLMAVLAFGFAYRWFGPRAALPAGLAQALMPVLWETGRAAEIEPLNNLGTQIAALALIHLLVVLPVRTPRSSPPPSPTGEVGRRRRVGGGPRRGRTESLLAIALASLGTVWFALAKGPASVPVVLAVIASACIVRRSARPLLVSLAPIALAAIPLAGLAWMTLRALDQLPGDPVTQSPAAFMFEPGMIVGVLTLPFAAFASMLPASFALLFPWGPDARTESAGGLGERGYRVARTLAIAWLVAVGLFMAFGVRNPRYTLPAACLLPPLAGAYLSGLGAWLTPTRDRIARTLTLGRPAILLAALLIGAAVYMLTVEASRRATSGTPAGEAIGDALIGWVESAAAAAADAEGNADADTDSDPGPITLIADDAIEARPEVLLAIERALADAGVAARVVWVPSLDPGGIPPGSGPLLALLRTDPESREAGLEAVAGRPVRSLSLGPTPQGWAFHKYFADLYLIEDRSFAD